MCAFASIESINELDPHDYNTNNEMCLLLKVPLLAAKLQLPNGGPELATLFTRCEISRIQCVNGGQKVQRQS